MNFDWKKYNKNILRKKTANKLISSIENLNLKEVVSIRNRKIREIEKWKNTNHYLTHSEIKEGEDILYEELNMLNGLVITLNNGLAIEPSI